MLPSPATDILVNRPAEEEQRSVQVQVEGAGTAIVPAPTQTTSTGTAAERKRGARGRGSKRNRSTAETVTTEGGEVDSAPETTHAAPAGNAFRIPKRPPPTLDEVQWRQRQAQARSYRGANRHLSQESQQLLREELRVFTSSHVELFTATLETDVVTALRDSLKGTEAHNQGLTAENARLRDELREADSRQRRAVQLARNHAKSQVQIDIQHLQLTKEHDYLQHRHERLVKRSKDQSRLLVDCFETIRGNSLCFRPVVDYVLGHPELYQPEFYGPDCFSWTERVKPLPKDQVVHNWCVSLVDWNLIHHYNLSRQPPDDEPESKPPESPYSDEYFEQLIAEIEETANSQPLN